MIRPLAAAFAALAIAAPAAAADGGGPPDAEIFATNNTAVITDPDDPRLDDKLKQFARDVERIIEDGGGDARGSELLDGVFFSSDQGTTTFERSRRFDVDDVEDDELHTIADTVRDRFDQQSVLTFDHLPRHDEEVDGILLEVPGVSAQALRDGLLADATAREELFGGSVTLDGRLLLVAELADAELARDFAASIGGDLGRAETHYGERAFVEGPLPVRVERRTLVVEGGSAGLALRSGKLEVDVGRDGSVDHAIARHRFDRIRVRGGDDVDTLALDGAPTGERFDVAADGDRVRLTRDAGDLRIDIDDIEQLRIAAREGVDKVTVGDLSATDAFQVDADLGAGADQAMVNASDGDEQISVLSLSGAASVLGPTFVRFEQPEAADRLRVDGRDGDDIVSASTATMRLTLDGGDGDNVLLGGPGDDELIGGDGFDDAKGGGGRDTATLGGHFDRFSWAPGDGSDVVDGGASRDSLSFRGTNDAEAFDLRAAGSGLRFTRDLDGIEMRLDRVEEIDPFAGGGTDTFTIGDLSRTAAELVDISLGSGLPGGDGAADRVAVAGTDRRDAMALAGRVVVGGTATLTGLAATVNVSHAEGALDTLAIDTRAGDDTLDTSAFDPATIGLEVRE
jgi:hypothetical protein